MEELLYHFVDTLEASLKRIHETTVPRPGMAILTISQLQYIDAVYALGSPTITQIADKLHISKASVTAAINKLTRMGYVVKTRSSEDRRVTHVSLTDASGQLVDAKIQTLQAYVAFIHAVLNEDEIRQLETILTKLVRHFDQAKEVA